MAQGNNSLLMILGLGVGGYFLYQYLSTPATAATTTTTTTGTAAAAAPAAATVVTTTPGASVGTSTSDASNQIEAVRVPLIALKGLAPFGTAATAPISFPGKKKAGDNPQGSLSGLGVYDYL